MHILKLVTIFNFQTLCLVRTRWTRGARPEFASKTNFDRGDKIWELRTEVDVEWWRLAKSVQVSSASAQVHCGYLAIACFVP